MARRPARNRTEPPTAVDNAETEELSELLVNEVIPTVNPEIGAIMTVTATAAYVWKTTPFSGDFNPGSKLRNIIFLTKTKDCMKIYKKGH